MIFTKCIGSRATYNIQKMKPVNATLYMYKKLDHLMLI